MEDAAPVAPRRRRRQKKKARAAAAAATLPDDVVLEILARVADDVAALFRCAVSSKRWRALVADPSFLRRRWPEGARDPGSLLGFFHDTRIYGTTSFVPAPRSPLGPRRRLLGSFFPNAHGLLYDAVPLASRSGLLLVRLHNDWADHEQGLVRLAVCNPLAGTWDELPPLQDVSSIVSNGQCAILTDKDHCPKGRLQKPLPSYTTLFKVIIIMVEYSLGPYKMYTFSSAESSWSTPRKCFENLEYEFIHGNPVVSQGKVHWLIQGKVHWLIPDSGNFCTLQFCIETGHISTTQFPIPRGLFETSFDHTPILSIPIDGSLSLISLHKNFHRLQIFTRQGDEGHGNGLADVLHPKVIELKHKPPQTTKGLYMYSLRFKFLVAEMDVSRTKIHLDTSIPATSNSERREYVGEKNAAMLVTDRRKFMCAVNLETGTIDEVTGMFGNLKLQTIVPFEIDWPAFFMSSLEAH